MRWESEHGIIRHLIFMEALGSSAGALGYTAPAGVHFETPNIGDTAVTAVIFVSSSSPHYF